MTKIKTGAGRPSKYDDNMLLQKLLDYRKVYDGIITLGGLEKATGIKKHVWRDRDIIRQKIEELNKIDIGFDGVDLEGYSVQSLPNIADIVERHYSSKNSLIKALQSYDDLIKRIYALAMKYFESHKKLKNIETENEKLKEDIKKSRQETEFYKNEYLKLTVLSESPTARKKNNIKTNVINLNKEELQHEVESFEDMFKEFNL